MSLWGTKPIKLSNFSTDDATTFTMDSSFQLIPTAPPPPPPKKEITMETLQTIMPPGVIKKNAHLINLLLKK